jgi:hypothetical protein
VKTKEGHRYDTAKPFSIQDGNDDEKLTAYEGLVWNEFFS